MGWSRRQKKNCQPLCTVLKQLLMTFHLLGHKANDLLVEPWVWQKCLFPEEGEQSPFQPAPSRKAHEGGSGEKHLKCIFQVTFLLSGLWLMRRHLSCKVTQRDVLLAGGSQAVAGAGAQAAVGFCEPKGT